MNIPLVRHIHCAYRQEVVIDFEWHDGDGLVLEFDADGGYVSQSGTGQGTLGSTRIAGQLVPTCTYIQWNPSNLDATGPEEHALFKEMSLFQGWKSTQT